MKKVLVIALAILGSHLNAYNQRSLESLPHDSVIRQKCNVFFRAAQSCASEEVRQGAVACSDLQEIIDDTESEVAVGNALSAEFRRQEALRVLAIILADEPYYIRKKEYRMLGDLLASRIEEEQIRLTVKYKK